MPCSSLSISGKMIVVMWLMDHWRYTCYVMVEGVKIVIVFITTVIIRMDFSVALPTSCHSRDLPVLVIDWLVYVVIVYLVPEVRS